jgi:uncharacterized protein (TIGR03083 family)
LEDKVRVTVGSQREELTARGRAAALRVAELVRALGPDASARRSPALEWTAIETAVHVVNLYRRALGDTRRSRTPEETTNLNAECLAEFTERDPQQVADCIAVDAVTVWNQVLARLPDDIQIPFHAGSTTTIGPIMGVLLTEMLVHGDDIARASGQNWVIDDDDAWRALRTIAVLLPAWRRAEPPASDTVALVGPNGDTVLITCDGSETTVAFEPARQTDRVVSGRPAEILLGLFGRRPSAPPLADLVSRFGPF